VKPKVSSVEQQQNTAGTRTGNHKEKNWGNGDQDVKPDANWKQQKSVQGSSPTAHPKIAKVIGRSPIKKMLQQTMEKTLKEVKV